MSADLQDLHAAVEVGRPTSAMPPLSKATVLHLHAVGYYGNGSWLADERPVSFSSIC